MTSYLRWMCKDLANNASFENTQYTIAMNVERFGEQRTIWKSTNDLITRKLKWIWKDLANNISFENSQIIGWQVNCANYREIWQTKPHFKIHKWLDDR